MLAYPYRERSQIPEVDAAQVALIPQPNQFELKQGGFAPNKACTVEVQLTLAEKASTWLQQELLDYV
ncbi:glycoside hydrolase family 20 zincin-like fold domain-containing protein [Vibrio chagasii]|nr:glycoside hydrolase family 20 zincin-like fold domain-containing protein [Vibrio chagasii]